MPYPSVADDGEVSMWQRPEVLQQAASLQHLVVPLPVYRAAEDDVVLDRACEKPALVEA